MVRQTYKAMEKLVATGKTKAIGISNFGRAELDRLLEHTTIIPAVHQMELHPWLQQKGFCDYHQSKGIHVTQYSPLGNQNPIYRQDNGAGADTGATVRLIDDPALVTVGDKYQKTGAQVALAWGIAHGRSVLPKSKTLSRIAENGQADFSLDQEDVSGIDQMDKKLRFGDPSKVFGANLLSDLDGKKQ